MKNKLRGLLLFFIAILLIGSVENLNTAVAADGEQITNALQIPDPRFPKNGYSITSGITLLEWSVSKDSTQYEIELFRPSGSRLDKWEIGYPVCTAATCKFKLPNYLNTEFGEYRWRVRGKTDSSFSAWSEFAMFTYVKLNDLVTLYPLPKESIYDSTPYFAWHDAEEDVYQYQLEIYQEDGTLVFRKQLDRAEVCDSENCSWSLTSPLSVGTYKWRVQGEKGPNATPWTELQIFLLIY